MNASQIYAHSWPRNVHFDRESDRTNLANVVTVFRKCSVGSVNGVRSVLVTLLDADAIPARQADRNLLTADQMRRWGSSVGPLIETLHEIAPKQPLLIYGAKGGGVFVEIGPGSRPFVLRLDEGELTATFRLAHADSPHITHDVEWSNRELELRKLLISYWTTPLWSSHPNRYLSPIGSVGEYPTTSAIPNSWWKKTEASDYLSTHS